MVADMDRSIAFYRDVLGFALREQRNLDNGTKLAFMQVGEAEIELIANPRDQHLHGDATLNHLAFHVSDLDAVLAQLRKHNTEMISPQPINAWEGMRIAFFRGPDGEKLELCERK